MRTEKRWAHGLVIGISMFICMMSMLANPSDSQAAAYSILHNFTDGESDGWQPVYNTLALSGSTLYGMTQDGRRGPGPPAYHYAGTLFRINADGTGYQILHDFGGSDGTDGTTPRGSLTLSGSTLYGFTAYGGGYNGGTIFKIDTSGGGYQVLKRFSTAGDQCNPYGAPVISGSRLYGMHSSESTGLKGAIFAMNTDGGGYQVLHNFAGKPDDGHGPYGSLTLVGSKLYGMTSTGGSGGTSGGGSGYGVIFSVDTNAENYQILHNFQGAPSDGSKPYGSLTLVGSKLYGMTSGGGSANGPGVLFSINLDGGGYQVVLDFSSVGSIGGPLGSLTLVGPTLYGMTSGGGPGGASGVIFQINPDGTGFKILHGFMASAGDGGSPMGDLTLSGSRLYGTTYAGGSAGGGVVFSYQPPWSDPEMMLLLLSD